MAAFFDKWAQAEGRFVPKPDAPVDFAVVRPESVARRAVDAGIECIGCGVCHSACDVVAWKPDYLGPAALNRAWTLVNDVRDGAKAERLAAVAGDAGCHACHSQQGCREFCPKHLNPSESIAGLKRATVAAAIRGEI
jgi:fumarate reductase iron-sulfur subunit